MFFPLCILCSLKWYFIWHLVVVNIHNQMVASLFEESRTKYGITLKSKAVKHLNPFSFCHPRSREIKTKLMVWFFSLLWKELCTACYLPRFSYHLFKTSHACSFPRPACVVLSPPFYLFSEQCVNALSPWPLPLFTDLWSHKTYNHSTYV